ncbi:MAG: hypothetical protein JWM05_1485, partial [Acidimicrobiales bacterium]|nr:hypothetical protein [Acidimicrobiales bacterium]
MSRFLYRLGRAAVRRRKLVLAAWLVVLVGSGFLGSALGGKGVDDFTIPGTETQAAHDLLKERFPAQSGSTASIVFAVADGRVTDRAVAARITDVLAAAKKQPHVVSVTPVLTPKLFGRADDGRIGFATVRYDGNGHELGDGPGNALKQLVEPLRRTGVQVELGGEIRITKQEVGGTSEAVGLIVAVFVLLIAFGSVVAMGLPLGTALIGLGAGLSLVTVGESFLTIPTIAPTLATMVGLGVGIDYALFIVTRHREHLHHGMTVEESAGRAIATAGQAVVFAGTTVVIAICGLQFVGIPLVAAMGFATAAVVAVSVVAAVTLLPALMGLAVHTIDRLRLPGIKAATTNDEHSTAALWSHH